MLMQIQGNFTFSQILELDVQYYFLVKVDEIIGETQQLLGS